MKNVDKVVRFLEEFNAKTNELIREINRPDIKSVYDLTDFPSLCAYAGENINDYIVAADAHPRKKALNGYAKRMLICEVFNEGTLPDYSNAKQQKWYAWDEYKAGSGFAFSGSDCGHTSTYVGARLVVLSQKASDHIGKHFLAERIESYS